MDFQLTAEQQRMVATVRELAQGEFKANALKYFTYHHTPADTLDKVVPEELRENAACMAVMGYALADMAGPLMK